MAQPKVHRESKPLHENILDKTDIEIQQIPYGKIPPTYYKSDLSHDDWIDQFLIYDYAMDVNPDLEIEEEELEQDDYGNFFEPYKVEDFIITEPDPAFIEEQKKKWRLPYLTRVSEVLWNFLRALVLLPRGYGKTERAIALYIRWTLEVMLPLMIITPKSTHSAKILSKIERAIKHPNIRRYYGDIIGGTSYSKDGMILKYRSSMPWNMLDYPIELYTFKSAKEGAHPAWLSFEDTWQVESKNQIVNDDIIDDLENKFLPMLSTNSKLTFTATRYGPLDIYNYLIKKQKIPVYHVKALEDDGTWLNCPRFTKEYILKLKDKNRSSFETQMNNNPVPSEGLYFEKDHWRSLPFKDVPYYTEMMYYMMIDPARGSSDSSDNTAIIVIGICNGKLYVVDGAVGKFDDDEKLMFIEEFHEKYNIAFTLLEVNYAQIDWRKFSHIRGIVQYNTKKNKILRINAMKPYFRRGLIWVVEGIQPYDYMYNEYLQYDERESTASRKDDAIDALSILVNEYGSNLGDYVDAQTDWSGDENFDLSLY